MEWCPKPARRFGIDDRNIALRRQFVRLGEEERALLLGMASWAESVAPQLAKEFYDWQFEFGPTREFFENFARGSGMPLASLRNRLESAQAKYFVEIFSGASLNWDASYFEGRLQIGAVHHRINLPFKWYVGAYAEYQVLMDKYLRRDFPDEVRVRRVEAAVLRVFNLDMQAIGDAFIMITLQGMLQSMGVGLDDLAVAGDKSESLDKIKQFISSQFNNLRPAWYTWRTNITKAISTSRWSRTSSVVH